MSSTQQDRRQASAKEQATEHFDAVIVGAGFSGLYALHKLRNEMGLSARVYEAGAARGIGTAIRARAAIRPVGSTATRSMRSSARNGSGANAIPSSQRY